MSDSEDVSYSDWLIRFYLQDWWLFTLLVQVQLFKQVSSVLTQSDFATLGLRSRKLRMKDLLNR